MDERLIFETALWDIFLSEDQTYFGRCVIELKRKCPSLSELDKDEILDFFEIVKRFEGTFKREYGAKMFNWTCLMNDAYKRKPSNSQVHWHCRPRYDHIVHFGNRDFIDPNFGHHYDREMKTVLDQNCKNKLISELRLKLAK